MYQYMIRVICLSIKHSILVYLFVLHARKIDRESKILYKKTKYNDDIVESVQ